MKNYFKSRMVYNPSNEGNYIINDKDSPSGNDDNDSYSLDTIEERSKEEMVGEAAVPQFNEEYQKPSNLKNKYNKKGKLNRSNAVVYQQDKFENIIDFLHHHRNKKYLSKTLNAR